MRTWLVALTVVGLIAVTVQAKKIRVPKDYPNIQAGIDAAKDGDTVLVADGVYTGDGNRDIDFGGKAITVRSENGPDNCIIDCQGSAEDPIGGSTSTRARRKTPSWTASPSRTGTPQPKAQGAFSAAVCISGKPAPR